MADTNSAVSGNPGRDDSYDQVTDAIRKLVTRRQFLKGTGALGLGVTTFYLLGCGSSRSAVKDEPRQIFVANALGMIVAEPSRCVGCRRCELACTEFNDGKAQPSISRIKVGRNYNVGPLAAQKGLMRGNGTWGDHRIIQDTCRQCPHPVPCQLACPHGAIEVVAPVNARVVNVGQMRRLRHLHAGLSLGNDVPGQKRRRKGDQMQSLQGVRRRLSGGGAEICGVVGQDQDRYRLALSCPRPFGCRRMSQAAAASVTKRRTR